MADTGCRHPILLRIAPLIAGALLIVVFTNLGLWQLDRASFKHELLDAFKNPASYAAVSTTLKPDLYRAIEATGNFRPDTQILIDNVIREGRLGYYVITAFDYAAGAPLLLVNRGWVEKRRGEEALPDIALTAALVTVRGKLGHLPRVGIRPGAAFTGVTTWPRVGVWPTTVEIAAELGREVLPYVLLLDPDQASGFERRWDPKIIGPSTHYGYAAQWFAMALVVLALVIWRFKKRRTSL